MAKDQRNVEAITPMEVDFAKWYTDICLKAELVDYASVKGFMILRPYGYAIWENIQRIMDGMFKKTGHVNVAMPVLIPESLLKKEGELVEGFAPEVAWVTMGGSEKLEERLAFRPTSETMFCDHWHNVLQSYRELPMLYNQWCSVIRWEKTTRPFLRSREFWWQEGHTIHETAEEAQAETEQQRSGKSGGGAEAGRAFDEGGEHEADDDGLHAAVGADFLHAGLDGFHGAAVGERVVDEQSTEDDDEHACGGDEAFEGESYHPDDGQLPYDDGENGARGPCQGHGAHGRPAQADHENQRHQKRCNGEQCQQFNVHSALLYL